MLSQDSYPFKSHLVDPVSDVTKFLHDCGAFGCDLKDTRIIGDHKDILFHEETAYFWYLGLDYIPDNASVLVQREMISINAQIGKYGVYGSGATSLYRNFPHLVFVEALIEFWDNYSRLIKNLKEKEYE